MDETLIFAIDRNLGFLDKDPHWQSLFEKFHIRVVFYDDMKKLTEDLEKNTIPFAYLPSAEFFYFKGDRYYTPIANAIFTATGTTSNRAVLITAKESPIASFEGLKGKKLGYIHPYCTSSYFAPALFLKQHNYSIHQFFSELKQVGAWQSQIDAVIAGKVDATMVLENVWRHLPENAQKTKILAFQDQLPSPVVLCGKDVDEKLKEGLKEALFSYKEINPHALFSGFVPFQQEQVHAFFSQAEQALKD